MNKQGILITGSEGTIGKVLTGYTIAESTHKPRLEGNITRVDARPARGSEEAVDLGEAYNRPAYVDQKNPYFLTDLTDDKVLEDLLRTHDTLVHGAWSAEGILDPNSHNPENLELVKRILKISAKLGALAAPKLVLPSSVNAHVPADWKERRDNGKFIDANESAVPHHHNRHQQPGPGLSRYGQTKLKMEQLAQEYANKHGLDISVPRIGAVNLADRQPSTYAPHVAVAEHPEKGKNFDLVWEDAVRLRHEDLVENVRTIAARKQKMGHFARYNLISDTSDRVHKI